MTSPNWKHPRKGGGKKVGEKKKKRGLVDQMIYGKGVRKERGTLGGGF